MGHESQASTWEVVLRGLVSGLSKGKEAGVKRDWLPCKTEDSPLFLSLSL